MQTTFTKKVDASEPEQKVKKMYSEMALHPDKNKPTILLLHGLPFIL